MNAKPALDALFSPRSVAVVGASDDPAKFGGRVLSYLKRDWTGRVTPVHPNLDRVQGIAAARRVSAIGEPVDLAVLALPSASVPGVLADCASAGVKAVVVFASGFAEAGPEGRQRQDDLRAAARSAGVRLLGPNCIGVVNCRDRFAATFATMWTDGWDAAGPVSIISQSGAMASYLYVLLQERGLGTSVWCSTGNEADVDVAECIACFASDPHTRVVLAALEGVPDGPRLFAAVAKARAAGKPVILIKIGRSAAGKAAAASHTGAVAGEGRVFDAAIEQAGGIVVDTFGAAIDLAALFVLAPLPAAGRLAIVSASGGGGIMAADRAEEVGLAMPALADATRARLDALIPAGGSSRNPVDVTAMVLGDLELMIAPIEVVAADPGIDAVIVFLTSAFRSDAAIGRIVERLAASDLRGCGKPILLTLFCGTQGLARLHQAGFAAYLEPVRAVDALAAALSWRSKRVAPHGMLPDLAAVDLSQASLEAGLLAELSAHGIPAAPTRIVASVTQARSAAMSLGPVVVMKLAVPGLAHKSELGGVITDIDGGGSDGSDEVDDSAVDRAFVRLSGLAVERGAPARVLVQRQVSGVVEMMIAMQTDPVFGRVIVVGLGGKWIEFLDDVAIRVAPVDEVEARAMLAGLRGAGLLHGARDLKPADVDALVAAIVAFSRLAVRLEGVASLEINPFIVGVQGAGGWAVDAKCERAG